MSYLDIYRREAERINAAAKVQAKALRKEKKSKRHTAYMRTWTKDNRERVNAYRKAWLERTGHGTDAAYMRAWRKRNPDKVAAYKRAWAAKNRAKNAEYIRRSRAKKAAEKNGGAK